jgi:hypothetical protein
MRLLIFSKDKKTAPLSFSFSPFFVLYLRKLSTGLGVEVTVGHRGDALFEGIEVRCGRLRGRRKREEGRENAREGEQKKN